MTTASPPPSAWTWAGPDPETPFAPSSDVDRTSDVRPPHLRSSSAEVVCGSREQGQANGEPLTRVKTAVALPANGAWSSSDEGSPSKSLQSTPEMSTSGSVSSISSPFTPHRSNQAITKQSTDPSLRSNPPPVMAARDRPVYQHGRTTSSSSNGSTSSTSARNKVAPVRRQLMPSIPIRRGSALSEPSSAQSSPNLGNQTNIQNLAQAIAARAQHVAAAKAAHVQAGNNGSSPSQSAHSGPAALTEAATIDNATSQTARVDQGMPSNALARLSVPSSVPSNYGDEESDPEDRESKENDADSHTPRPASVHLSAEAALQPQKGIRPDRDEVAQSFRWSQGDWAEYAAVLSDKIDIGLSPDAANSQSNEGVFVAPPSTSALAEVRKSTQFAPSANGLLSGLGIGGAGVPSTLGTEPIELEDKSSGLVKSTSAPVMGEYTTPLLAQIGRQLGGERSAAAAATASGPMSPSSEGLASSASTPDALTSKRKVRPKPLNLSQSPSTPALRSPSASRSLASPSVGGRTPPPTMPPTEPLPPLPAESTVLRRMWSNSDIAKMSPKSTRASGTSDSQIVVQEQLSHSKGDEEERERKRSSDPSDNRSFFMRINESPSVEGVSRMPRKNSLPQAEVTPADLTAKSVALARANRVSTIAGAEHAQSVLDQMRREPTFNEATGRTGSEISSANGSGPADAEGSSSHGSHSSVSNARRSSKLAEAATTQPIPAGEEQEELQGNSEEEAEEAEEAVVTRVMTTVKGARASLSRAPSIVRRGSATSNQSSGQRSTDAPNGSHLNAASDAEAGQASNTVTRMRAMIEARNGGGTTIEAPKPASSPATMDTPSSEKSQATALPLTASGSSATTGKEGGPSATNEIGDAKGDRRRSSSAVPPSAWNGVTGRPSLNMATQPQRVAVSASIVSDTTSVIARSPSATSLHGQTGTWTPTLDTPTLTGGYEYPNGPLSSAHSTASYQQRPHSGLQNRRTQMDDDSHSLSNSPLERMKRTEGRFTGAFGEIALAFKQLQAEKRTLEKVIRATTPLDGLGNNGESLAEYLTMMGAKLDTSAQEIRKLLDLLDQQRSVMDYMTDTHRLEMEAQTDELEDLKDDFDAVCEEADTHRANAIRLTEELDKSQRDAIMARAETLRFKAALQEEESRKEKSVRLLRQARSDLDRLERERDTAQATLRSARQASGEQTTENTLEEAGKTADHGSMDRSADTSADHANTSTKSSVDESQDGERFVALERELAEAKLSNLELQRQLQEQQQIALKSMSESPANRSFTASVPLSDAEDAERERDVLREKSLQQEKDIAELRAQIALGAIHGVAHDSGTPLSSGGLPAAREDQIRLLMAQMSEQRAREAQIRKAYRQLRDDLRKMQTAQQHDRKRTQATFSFLAGGQASTAGSAISPLNAIANPPTSYHAVEVAAKEADLRSAYESGTLPRNLKRLSLPLVNKIAPLSSNGGTSTFGGLHAGSYDDSPTGQRSPVRPMSSLTTTNTAPIFSSSRRSSRTFSVDFAAHAKRILPRSNTDNSANGSEASAEYSPRTAAHRALTGGEAMASPEAVASGASSVLSASARDTEAQETLGEDAEGMEHLRTPRQSMLAD